MWQINQMQGNCNIPSNVTEKDLAEEEFVPGSLVWAKLGRYPWWPGLIEDCPDEGHFFRSLEEGKEYHVIFFADKPLRSWMPIGKVIDFHKPPPDQPFKKKPSCYKALERAMLEAQKAAKIPLQKRLNTYSFAVRYEGKWGKNSKVSAQIPKPNQNSAIKMKKVKGKEDNEAQKQSRGTETNEKIESGRKKFKMDMSFEQIKSSRKRSKVEKDLDSKVPKVNASKNTTVQNSSEALVDSDKKSKEVKKPITDDHSKVKQMGENSVAICNEEMSATNEDGGSEARQMSKNDAASSHNKVLVEYTPFEKEYIKALKFYYQRRSNSNCKDLKSSDFDKYLHQYL